MRKRLGVALVAGVLTAIFGAGAARAGESQFAWTYTLDLQPTNTWQLEQWLWLQEGQARGDYHYLQAKTELEYGVTPWYQVGLYLNTSYASARANGVTGLTGGPGVDLPPGFPPSGPFDKARFDSVAMENVIRLMNPYTDGFGLGIYIEPAIGPHSQELEFKVLGQKNFLDDRLVLAANIATESEHESFYGVSENASTLDLLVGASYRFAPGWFAALEFRNHREFEGNLFKTPEHSAYFAGPTLHYAAESWWMTVGWRHQLPVVQTFNAEQTAAVKNGRIYGGEHARDEFMLRVGIPL